MMNLTSSDTIVDFMKDLRIMFYGVGIKEMAATESMQDVPDYFVKAVPYFLLMIVIEQAVALMKGKSVYRYNDTIASLMLGSVQLLMGFWINFLGTVSYCWMYDSFRLLDHDTSNWITWLGCLLIVDCGYYWMHRHAHTYHLFWSAHSVHHSGEDYNFATALRQGTLQPGFSWLYQLPAALFFHPLFFVHHKALNTLYQFWIHTTLIGHLGPFEYIFNTASHHRMHHRPPGNCNYAGVLIIWDRMFGTFVAESEQMDYYGLAKQYSTFDPVYANAEHLNRMASNIDPTQKRGAFFYLGLLFKRRVKHKSIFNPMAVFSTITPPKNSLWTLSPVANKRSRYDGYASAKTISMYLYSLFLFIGAISFTLASLLEKSSMTVYSIIPIQIVCLTSYSAVGKTLDGFNCNLITFNCWRIVGCLCFACWLYGSVLAEPLQSISNAFQLYAAADSILWALVYILNSNNKDKIN